MRNASAVDGIKTPPWQGAQALRGARSVGVFLRILVRSAQDPREILGATKSTRQMGGNSGNLLYSNAVQRGLSVEQNTITAGGFAAHTLDDASDWIAKANRRFDRYVVPMSNAFRYGFSQGLERMTTIVRGLDMPVTVVGVGAQTTADAAEAGNDDFRMGKTGSAWAPSASDVERHDGVVRNFVEAVLEKSATIGVRGEVTKRYLESIGIDGGRVDVIGCPSLYTWGPDLRITKRVEQLKANSKISMNVDFRVKGIGEIIEKNAAMYRNMTSPVQDSKSARMIITGQDQFDMAKRDPLTPIHREHVLYQTRRLVYYPNPWGWIESMKSQDFAFGNRLHGNISALLAGTPVHLIAHDSRTVELAEYHAIPHTLITDFDEAPSAAELFAQADYTRFNELQPVRFQTYLDFLHRNGLETVFDEGQSADAFDHAIEAGKRVGPVRPALNRWDRSMRKFHKIS